MSRQSTKTPSEWQQEARQALAVKNFAKAETALIEWRKLAPHDPEADEFEIDFLKAKEKSAPVMLIDTADIERPATDIERPAASGQTQDLWVLVSVVLLASFFVLGFILIRPRVEPVVEIHTTIAVVTRVVEVTPIMEATPEVVVVDPTECRLDAPNEPVEIKMIGWAFDITEYYARELEKCGRVENLTVTTEFQDSTEVKDQVTSAMFAFRESQFDIVHGATSEVSGWGGEGGLLPLDSLVEAYWDEYNLDDIPANLWEMASYKGRIYGIPIATNTVHFIYREDVLDVLNLPVPKTYDDILAMCEAVGLDNPDFDMPFALNLSAKWAWEIEFFQIHRALGGRYLDAENRPIFNDETGVEAVNLLLNIAETCMGEQALTFDIEEQQYAMQTGRLVATNTWASRTRRMHDRDQSDYADEVVSAPAPSVVDDGLYAGSAWADFYMIPANVGNDPDLIFRIIMEAVDERSQYDAAQFGIATRSSAVEDGLPNLRAVNLTIIGGVGNYEQNPAVQIARAELGEFLSRAGDGTMTVEEALDAAAEAYLEEAIRQGYVDK